MWKKVSTLVCVHTCGSGQVCKCICLCARFNTANLTSKRLTGPSDTAGDWMAVNNFSHEVVVSTLNHSEKILLQHCLTLYEWCPPSEHSVATLLDTVWIVSSYFPQFSISQTQFYSYLPPVCSILWCDVSLELQMCWSGGHCWYT